MSEPTTFSNPSNRKRKQRLVPEHGRKKVARACNNCKKRKIKCDGQTPCATCTTRRLQCVITEIDKRSLKGMQSTLKELANRGAPPPPVSDLDLLLGGLYNRHGSGASPVDDGSQEGMSLAPHAGPSHGPRYVPHRHSRHLKGSPTTTRGYPIGDTRAPTSPKSHVPVTSYLALGFPCVGTGEHLLRSATSLDTPVLVRTNGPSVFNEPHPLGNKPTSQTEQPSVSHQVLPHTIPALLKAQDGNPQEGNPQEAHPETPPESHPPETAPSSLVVIPSTEKHREALKPSLRDHATIENPGTAATQSLERDTTGRILYDASGNLRYIGESSVLTVIAQMRFLLRTVMGESLFTKDPQGIQIADHTVESRLGDTLQLPSRECTDQLVASFALNFNQTHYVFEMGYVRRQVEAVYADPLNFPPSKLCLLHFVLGLGSMFSVGVKHPGHARFFESGLALLSRHGEDGNLWLVEAYLLLYLYNEALCRRNTAWINIGVAIRYGFSLGLNKRDINESFASAEYRLHRRKLWRSLYINDRILSTILGRSLTISDADWDDLHGIQLPRLVGTGRLVLQELYEHELFRVSEINGRIIQRVYTSPRFDIAQAKASAAELKLWYTNLWPQLRVRHILEPGPSPPECHTSGTPLHLLHLTHLYGIILLSRPFHHYLVLLEYGIIPEATPSSFPEDLLVSFSGALLRASVLTIKLAAFSVDHHKVMTGFHHWLNHLLNAGLMVGSQIMVQIHARGRKRIYDTLPLILFATLETCVRVLEEFLKADRKAKRYAYIIREMTDALRKASVSPLPLQPTPPLPPPPPLNLLRQEPVRLSDTAESSTLSWSTGGAGESLDQLVDFQYDLELFDHPSTLDVLVRMRDERVLYQADGCRAPKRSGEVEERVGYAPASLFPKVRAMDGMRNLSDGSFLDSFLYDLGFKGTLNLIN